MEDADLPADILKASQDSRCDSAGMLIRSEDGLLDDLPENELLNSGKVIPLEQFC